jgi:uncharacterized protein YndB with AHSA1/START domain
MAASNAGSSAATTADRELVFTRVFDAPRDLVFEAWTDPKHVAQWWGPRGFTTTIQEMDVRPGGIWRLVMRGPDGADYKNKIVFLEVVKPQRLVYKHEPEKDTEPVNFEATVTFSEQDNKTKVMMRMLFPSAATLEHVAKKYGAIEGANQTLARLAEHLTTMTARNTSASEAASPKQQDLVMTRIFDAPRKLVFEAWAKSEHVSRWFGPKGFTVPTCKIDFRPGGAFRFVMRGPDGKDYPFDGVYLEIAEPERIVFQGTIHDVPGHEVWTTVTFAEEQNKTILTVHQVYSFQSDDTRGAPEGWKQTLDRLAEHLANA